jgi:hypothetical protein
MKRTYQPAYIVDSYYDVLAINATTEELLNMDFLDLEALGRQPFGMNMLRFGFSEDGAEHFDALMGGDLADLAFQTVMLFRTVTLRYRATDHFQNLLRELNKYRLFKRYWREVYYEEKDQFVDDRRIRVRSPKWGLLLSYCTTVTALTSAGELHLCTYAPTDYRTAQAFSEIAQQNTGPKAYRAESWPDKGVPGANRLQPIY